ncbi:MAG: NAD-dependent succinate-semialdehyde dehydrogenase [Anaerolineae bacterium]
MLINGVWVDAKNGGTWDVVNPATEGVIATVPFGDARDAYTAIDAAAEAQPGWARMTAYERGAILVRIAYAIRERIEELAPIMTRECGKPLAEARGEWNAAADLFEWFAEEGKRAYGRAVPARRANKRLLVLREPMGVIATITAWNFPAYLPARKWSAALAAGCTVVGRPSELTPMSAMALVNVMAEAGIPAGVMNLVNGKPEEIGQAFLQSPVVSKISFTGSQRVGQILMRGAAERIKKLSLELGGSAPVLVFDDVDVAKAAEQVVTAKFRNNGQVCISPARFYVQRGIFEDFLDATQQRINALKLGNGLETGITTGPMVTAAGRERVESFVTDAVAKGATVVTGGQRPATPAHGYFYQPTLLTNVNPVMRISCDEVFGPVMPISQFETLEDGLRQANATPFGLAGYALTNDFKTAVQVYEGLKFGIVGMNDLVPATAEAPFGGIKESGFGSEGSQEGLLEYLNTKFVSMGI